MNNQAQQLTSTRVCKNLTFSLVVWLSLKALACASSCEEERTNTPFMLGLPRFQSNKIK